MTASLRAEQPDEWHLRILGRPTPPSATIYRFIADGNLNGVFIADCDGDETVGDVFARGMRDAGLVDGAFDALNRWLLGAGRGNRSVPAVYAIFLPGGLVRLSWAGYHAAYLVQRDGSVAVQHCPSLALGVAPGVTSRDALSVLNRGETLFIPNAPLERLLGLEIEAAVKEATSALRAQRTNVHPLVAIAEGFAIGARQPQPFPCAF